MRRPVPSWQGTCTSLWDASASANGLSGRPGRPHHGFRGRIDHIRGKETAALMPRKNLLSLFADFARFGGDVAVIQRRGYRRQKLTYTELYSSALFWSHALAGRGVVPGDRVLLWGPNSAEWVACFWGILLRGAIVVPMDPAASPDFLQRAIEDAGVKLILRDSQQAELPGLPPSMIINDSDVVNGPVPSQNAGPHPGNASIRSTIAEVLYTSGTTAEPRGVVLTHGNFLANLEPLERGIAPYRKYERWLHPLRFVTLVPFSHVFGQFMALFVPPLLGATVVFEASPNAVEVIRSVKRERATALITVPHMLDLLRSGMARDLEARGETEWFARTFSAAKAQKFLRRAWMFRRIHRRFGWKFWAFVSGGAVLSPETEDFFKRLGYAVVQGYGMTETASLISLNHPFRATQGSIGKVLPGRDFRLAKDGEILVRGENVASGYWQNGALQDSSGAAKENDGWLRTGDLGELDSEGNLRFRGRKKSVIVTPAGLNVYPEDLEAALRQQPGIRDCVVIPKQREGNAEPLAALLLRDPSDQAASRVIEDANRSLAEYQKIRAWITWPDLDFPRTPTGKPKLAEVTARVTELSSESKNDDFRNLAATDRSTRTTGNGGRLSSETTTRVSDVLTRLAVREQPHNLERDLNLS